MKNTRQTLAALNEAKIKHYTSSMMSGGFHGTRIILERRKDLRAADKATGHEFRLGNKYSDSDLNPWLVLFS